MRIPKQLDRISDQGRPIDAALIQLIRAQAVARVRRIARGFTTPRRLVLSIVGLVLAVIWLANALVSMMLREPARPETLRSAIPLGLLAYAIWHILKVTYRRPDDVVQWTSAEQEQLVGRPFSFRQLLTYRLLAIGGAAVFKSLLFLLLLLPDLQMPLASFFAMLAALLVLDFWRMAVEISAWGMARETYVKFRWATVTVTAVAALSALVLSISSPNLARLGRSPAAIGLLLDVLNSLASLRNSWVGLLVELPFQPFGVVVSAGHWTGSVVTACCLIIAEVFVAGWLVIHLAEWFRHRVARRESALYDALSDGPGSLAELIPASARLPRVAWIAGAGPICWRQMLGARHYAVSLTMALTAPALLSCLPLLVFDQPRVVALNVFGALAFYSFLLLPSALKLDFRRDIDRMTVLKSLPIRPAAMVIGQLATPVLVSTAFQFVVLAVAVVASPIGAWLIPAALAVLVPLNILVFALDNLIYLLYPYRLNQEGLEVFLRTTLTFTAKGLLFAIAILATLAWAMAAGRVAQWIPPGPGSPGATVFVVGAWCFLAAAAAITLWLLVRVYHRFDPSCDVPA